MDSPLWIVVSLLNLCLNTYPHSRDLYGYCIGRVGKELYLKRHDYWISGVENER